MSESRPRTIQLSADEVILLLAAVNSFAFSDENPYGSLACEKIGERLQLILNNQ